MNTPKPWYLSKTMWGALLTLLVTLIKDNYHVDLSDQVAGVETFVLSFLQFVGVVATMIGRFSASQPLTLGRTPPPAKVLPSLVLLAGVACALFVSIT